MQYCLLCQLFNACLTLLFCLLLDKLPRARGQGLQPRGATPRPRSSGFVGAGGLRGATPRSRSGGVAMRIPLDQVKRNPSKMVGVVRGHQRADTLTL